MAKPGSVNPLMLLIIAQAWCHVKRAPKPAQDLKMGDNLPSLGWSGDEEIARLPKMFSPESWSHLLLHPFFTSSYATHPLSMRHLVKAWNTEGDGCVHLTDAADLGKIEPPPEGFRAVRMPWNASWAKDMPQWAAACLQWRSNQKIQVWMEVSPTPQDWSSLNEDVMRRSIQLGWAWWMTPPSAEQFPVWLGHFKTCFKTWLHHPEWDQWVWPWSDIVVKKIIEHMGGGAVDRPWISDQRAKAAWSRLEEDVWCEVEKVMGGPASFQLLISSVMAELDRMDGVSQSILQDTR